MGETSEHQSISGERMNSVHASSVTMTRSAADSVTSERASFEQSSVKQLETSSAQFDRSSVFRMTADNAVISHSAATFVRADDARLVNCNSIYVSSPEATIEGDLKTVLYNGNATGNVHMIFDKESALRFGMGLGASLVGLGVLVRRLFR